MFGIEVIVTFLHPVVPGPWRRIGRVVGELRREGSERRGADFCQTIAGGLSPAAAAAAKRIPAAYVWSIGFFRSDWIPRVLKYNISIVIKRLNCDIFSFSQSAVFWHCRLYRSFVPRSLPGGVDFRAECGFGYWIWASCRLLKRSFFELVGGWVSTWVVSDVSMLLKLSFGSMHCRANIHEQTSNTSYIFMFVCSAEQRWQNRGVVRLCFSTLRLTLWICRSINRSTISVVVLVCWNLCLCAYGEVAMQA